ncbi:MAG: histidinol-phosphate transaminase [Candidatus Poribacteria bacterium]|nr:histidinol-phosphate transaminase [Candidatus Poribacteria bacterium]
MNLRQFLRADLADLKAYHVDQPPHRAKLDANESPFDLPPEIRQELSEEIARLPFQRYPDGTSDLLRTQLSERLGVDKAELVVGNGSDELIGNFMLAFGRSDACASFPIPTFSMYGILAQIARLKAVGLPLNAQFDLDADEWMSHLDTNRTNLVFISYPNNPTGNNFSAEVIHRMLSRPDTLVLLDEAYYEFSGQTFIEGRDRYPNLIITRTFSKAYGLAGLRIGYLIARPEITHEINKVRLPYNLNRFSQVAATCLLKHHDRFRQYIRLILSERERVFNALDAMGGVHPFPTDANFILFRTDGSAPKVFQRLLENGVLVRNLDRPGPLQNCLRVTIGTPEENDMFLEGLED